MLALITNAALSAGGVDWYRWRGPDLNGISTETGWQAQWPAAGPKQLWKASVGTGFASFSVSGDTILPRLPGLEDRDDRRYFGMVIRPNCFLSLLPDHIILHRFEPVSPELTTVVCEWLFPPETVATYDIGDTIELFDLVNQQDFAAAEWCQPNMRSRAYANGGVLVPTEQEIIGRWYYRWYRESMGLGDSL